MRFAQRLALMAAFGFFAGLPLPLSGFTLRQWFSEGGVPLELIGATASIGLAYTLKFLWAPILDRAPAPCGLWRFGRRRGWLLTVQPLLAAAGALLALSDPVAAPWATVGVAACVAFLSATQDVAVDAWRIESFGPREQGAAMAAYVWGYRGALLISGAGAIALVGPLGWEGALLLLAALMACAVVPTLLAREPSVPESALLDGGLHAAVVAPFTDFMQRQGAWLILSFIALYRLGEATAGVMAAPFYRSLGFDRAVVALANGPVSLTATLAGAALGGALVARIGVGRALLATGVAQMLSNLMYVWLAHAAGDLRVLYAQATVEAFTDGLADAAFIAYLSGLTSVAFTATQYALLSSLAAVALRTVGGLSGFAAAALGWPGFYLATVFSAVPAMLLMLVLLRRFPPQEGRAGVSRPSPGAAAVRPGPGAEAPAHPPPPRADGR